MIAITGATGQLGQATIQALLLQVAASKIVAVVRDPQKAAALRQAGVQVRPGDYNDPTALLAAFQGVDTVLLISTSETDYDTRLRQYRHVIDAARQAGVRHVAYTSVINPAPDAKFLASPGHFATEEYLRASGLTYTLFRNTLYLDLVPMLIGADALPSGKFYFAAGEGWVSYALREDIAQALANVLATSPRNNQTYDIDPGPAYSLLDVAATLCEVTGQPVEYVPISTDALTAGLRQHQVPEPMIGVFSSMAEAMKANEFNMTSADLEQLLGRQPTDLKTYLTSVYSK